MSNVTATSMVDPKMECVKDKKIACREKYLRFIREEEWWREEVVMV
jgi:hypothetical protein